MIHDFSQKQLMGIKREYLCNENNARSNKFPIKIIIPFCLMILFLY